MKPISTLSLLLGFYSITLSGQSQWINYTNDRNIADVLVASNNIWVASQGGLTSTNILTGDFQSYLPYNSPIKGGGVTAAEIAPDNSLWFASENAGLFCQKNGDWTQYYDNLIFSPYYKIYHLQILLNGDVWFYLHRYDEEGNNALIRIRNGEVKSFGNLPDKINSVAVVDDQTIYISTLTQIHHYDATKENVSKVYDSSNSIIRPNEEFREIITFRSESVLLGSKDRILQFKNDTLSILATKGAYIYKSFIDGVGNVYLHPYNNDPNGFRLIKYDGAYVTYYRDVDLGTYPTEEQPEFKGADGQGILYAFFYTLESEYTLYQFDGTAWTPVKTQINPMLTNYQDDVKSDCDGNLWFSSRDGVDVRYTDGSWQHFAVNVGLHHYFLVANIVIDPVTCDVWVSNKANNSGNQSVPGIIRISNGTITPFLPGHSNVNAMEATLDGRLYFFSGNSGLGYIENDVVTYIDSLDQFFSAYGMDSDSKGNLYVATWDDLYKYDGENLTVVDPLEFTSVVYGVYVDNDDKVWVHFSGGLKVYEGEWKDYSDVWPVSTFNGIVQDNRGNYWVSTWHEGLYYWDRHNLQNYNIFNSDLTTNSLRSVDLDPDGNLIVTQHVGASVLKIPEIHTAYKGTGHVYFDFDKNGSFDNIDDIYVPGEKILDKDRNIYSVTNFYGKYTFYSENPTTDSFEHELKPNAQTTTENPQYGTFTDDQSILPDFGFWKPHNPDIDVHIINGVTVCNRDFTVDVFIRNNSIYTTTGKFTLLYTAILTLVESSISYSSHQPGILVYEDLSIKPFEVLHIKLVFTAPGATNETTVFHFEGLFEIIENTFAGYAQDILLCSYDPNDKKVEPTGDFIPGYSLIEDALKYTIRFQNEGSYKAFDVTIIDTLEADLDPSTFELIGSSHNVETTITTNGIITFTFPNIDLPTRDDDEPGSQGFVAFSVKPDSSISEHAEIENTAGIYFDFNPPIVTNTTQWQVVEDLAIVSTKEINIKYLLYPNPSQGLVWLNVENDGDYLVLDGLGRHITAGKFYAGNNSIWIDAPTGVYYLQLRNQKEVCTTTKIVIVQ